MTWPLRQRHVPGLSLIALGWGLLGAACSGASGTPSAPTPTAPTPTAPTPTAPTPIELTPTELTPAATVERNACSSDADCVVGSVGDCCSSSGSSCAEAWSRRAWEGHRAKCAVIECARVKQLQCFREEREWKAVCNAGTCILQ